MATQNTELKLKVSLVNDTEGYIFSDFMSDLDWYKWDGEYDLTGLFRALQQEYGRCISKMYQETKDPHKPRTIGWVFEKRQAYSDQPNKTYLQQAWVGVVEYTPASYRYRGNN